MAKRLTLPQLKKYDVTQKVIESLADAESRAILFSTIRKGKSATELSHSLKIPLSSIYKKLNDLQELTLVEIQDIKITDKGRECKLYRSRIKNAEISIKTPNAKLILIPNGC